MRVLFGAAELFKKLFRGFVRLGMHAGVVEYFVSVGNTQKSRSLLERLCSETRHFQNLASCSEFSVGFAVFHDIFSGGGVDSRDIGKKRIRRSVYVHSDRVHARLNDACESFIETRGLHVVLILTDAYGFRVYLHKLRKRVLKSSRYGYRASLSYVKVREFLGSKLRRGIYARSGFGDYDILCLAAHFTQKIRYEHIALSRRSSVSDSDHVNRILFDKAADYLL